SYRRRRASANAARAIPASQPSCGAALLQPIGRQVPPTSTVPGGHLPPPPPPAAVTETSTGEEVTAAPVESGARHVSEWAPVDALLVSQLAVAGEAVLVPSEVLPSRKNSSLEMGDGPEASPLIWTAPLMLAPLLGPVIVALSVVAGGTGAVHPG